MGRKLEPDPDGWIRGRFDEVVVVCRRCARKVGRKEVRAGLKGALKAEGLRRVRIVETGCLGLCPKDAVVVATAASLAERRLRLLLPGPEAAAAFAATLPGAGRRGQNSAS